VTNAGQNTFSVTAVSKATTAGANNTFTIERDGTGATLHTCTGGGGCKSGTW
jgi:hypothetical protein